MRSPFVQREGNTLQLQFPYNPRHVNGVKAIHGAKWDPLGRTWSFPYSDGALDLLKKIFGTLQVSDNIQGHDDLDPVNLIAAEEKKYLPTAKEVEITDFVFATQPFWHQKVTFNFARSLPQTALFLEQGLGKAKIAIDLSTWRFRNKQVTRVLVVCPNSVIGQWGEEIRKHGSKDFKNTLLLQGSSNKKLKLLQDTLEHNFEGFIVINYDALRPLWEAILRMQRGQNKLFQMMVLDESSRIKHANSQRSKISWKLGQTVTYRNILTGTPITQSAEDVFGQYRFLSPLIFGLYSTPFRANYLLMGGFENRQVIGYKNINDFLKKVYTLAIRFTKDRCLDLPPKVYQRRAAVLDKDLSAKYRQLEKECVAEFGGHDVAAPLVMTKLMKLSQLTGGFIYEQAEDGTRLQTHIFKTAKLDILDEILDETLPQKIIVWCRFTQELKNIRALLEKNKITSVSIAGDVKSEDRAKAVKDFQENPKVKVFVGQVSTAGLGITLTAANVVVYYSNTYSLEDRLQSEDRCHRIGQDHSVTYIDILAETSDGRRTIDHDVLSAVKGKAAFANEISMALMQKMVFRQEEAKSQEVTGVIMDETSDFTSEEDEF